MGGEEALLDLRPRGGGGDACPAGRGRCRPPPPAELRPGSMCCELGKVGREQSCFCLRLWAPRAKLLVPSPHPRPPGQQKAQVSPRSRPPGRRHARGHQGPGRARLRRGAVQSGSPRSPARAPVKGPAAPRALLEARSSDSKLAAGEGGVARRAARPRPRAGTGPHSSSSSPPGDQTLTGQLCPSQSDRQFQVLSWAEEQGEVTSRSQGLLGRRGGNWGNLTESPSAEIGPHLLLGQRVRVPLPRGAAPLLAPHFQGDLVVCGVGVGLVGPIGVNGVREGKGLRENPLWDEI